MLVFIKGIKHVTLNIPYLVSNIAPLTRLQVRFFACFLFFLIVLYRTMLNTFLMSKLYFFRKCHFRKYYGCENAIFARLEQD